MTVTTAAHHGPQDNDNQGNDEEKGVLDLLIVGAGLSGIGAACRLREQLPQAAYAILEARSSLGGTWDLFRYPGVRSDSDMYTLSYPFEPWRHDDAIASGQDILDYLRTTAERHGVTDHIHYEHRVTRVEWSSATALWTVTADTPTGQQTFTARFVHLCSGYYSYDAPHQADIPGLADFAGPVIHPQFWPEKLDVTGKKVTVIGSGATAISIVPALAASSAEVTMLQRTPSFVLSQPRRDPLARLLGGRISPARLQRLARAKNVGLQWASYRFCRVAPRLARAVLKAGVRLGAGAEHVASFDAPYKPWDQRLCVVPDGDLLTTIRAGKARVVTDTIDVVTADAVRTTSGEVIATDILVTATGLALQVLGGAEIVVDGETVDVADRLTYRGCMLEGVPNLGVCIGYINASWGLRSDLTNQFIVQMLTTLRTRGAASAVPTAPAGLTRRPLLEMASGYIQRGSAQLPRRSTTPPWTLRQDYWAESREMRHVDPTIDITFHPAPQQHATQSATALPATPAPGLRPTEAPMKP